MDGILHWPDIKRIQVTTRQTHNIHFTPVSLTYTYCLKQVKLVRIALHSIKS